MGTILEFRLRLEYFRFWTSLPVKFLLHQTSLWSAISASCSQSSWGLSLTWTLAHVGSCRTLSDCSPASVWPLSASLSSSSSPQQSDRVSRGPRTPPPPSPASRRGPPRPRPGWSSSSPSPQSAVTWWWSRRGRRPWWWWSGGRGERWSSYCGHWPTGETNANTPIIFPSSPPLVGRPSWY